MLDVVEYLYQARQPGFSQDTDLTNQPSNTAGSEGSSGEANQEDLVTGGVIVAEERVAGTNVV